MELAFLIMAHNNRNQLRLLLSQLDYQNVDIFLHIDKKSDIQPAEMENLVKNANMNIYKKYSVYWGDKSQTVCQFFLLKEALKSKHDYYSLISGSDLLLKRLSEFEDFLEKHKGTEFVHFLTESYTEKSTIMFYHLFSFFIARVKNIFVKKTLLKIDNILVSIQKKLSIHKELYTGANWYTITEDLAKRFCQNENRLLNDVRWTDNSDEVVLQTYIKKYDDNYNIYGPVRSYKSILRCIDWYRGKPYVWRIEDYDSLINSEYFFARKFDENIDMEIIEKIVKRCSDENK